LLVIVCSNPYISWEIAEYYGKGSCFNQFVIICTRSCTSSINKIDKIRNLWSETWVCILIWKWFWDVTVDLLIISGKYIYFYFLIFLYIYIYVFVRNSKTSRIHNYFNIKWRLYSAKNKCTECYFHQSTRRKSPNASNWQTLSNNAESSKNSTW
jgi:hypothetical protein